VFQYTPRETNLDILGLDVLDEVNHTGGVAELIVVPEIKHEDTFLVKSYI
jgi:hypothetical protein